MRWVIATIVAAVALLALLPAINGVGLMIGVTDLGLFDDREVTPPDPNDRLLPPVFMDDGDARFLLGTDADGRDLLDDILGGAQRSFGIGAAAALLAAAVGVLLGLLVGYARGWVGRAVLRFAGWLAPFPPLIVALLAAGAARAVIGPMDPADTLPAMLALVLAIARWPQFLRLLESTVRAQRQSLYCDAARLLGLSPRQIAIDHVLPNVSAPMAGLWLTTIGAAVMDEATLSFLGVGMPAARPSLGTLVRLGQLQMDGGSAWWTWLFPALVLAVPLMAVSLRGSGAAADGAR